MKEYIKSTRSNLVYEIERQSFTEKFRTPEDYFTHATRSVWYSTTGFNMFVQYKGAFYMIDRTDAHGYITTLEFSPVTAEEAAAAKMDRAAQAMSEAQEHEAKTAAAALDYDTETAEAEAREAGFSAAYAVVLAKDAAAIAAKAGTSEAASIADAASEYAERAREYARSATETAEQAAAEAEQRAKADDAAARFCAALTEATGELPYFGDAASVCKVARDDIAGEHRSTALDRDAVNLMTEAIADAARAADPEDLEEPAPTYQRYELLAYLGEPDNYDVDAIEAEATSFTADGARVWSAFGSDLADAAERHELYQYAPVA